MTTVKLRYVNGFANRDREKRSHELLLPAARRQYRFPHTPGSAELMGAYEEITFKTKSGAIALGMRGRPARAAWC